MKPRNACPNLAKPLSILWGYVSAFFFSSTTGSATEASFPAEGTFNEQQEFVDKLPKGCSKENDKLVTSIVNMENPFAYEKPKTLRFIGDLSPEFDVETWRHTFDAEFGTLTKRTKQEYSDKTTITVAAEGTEPATIHFQLTSTGDWRPFKKEKTPMSVYAKALDRAENEAFVVKATKKDFLGGKETCFQVHKRKGKTA